MSTTESAATSAPQSTVAGKLVAVGGVVVSCLYLANLTAGVIPLEIPDVIPGIGNLDEVIVSGILIASLAKLGINVIPGMHAGRGPTAIEGKVDPPK